MKILNFILYFLLVIIRVNLLEANDKLNNDINDFMGIMDKFKDIVAKITLELEKLFNEIEIAAFDIINIGKMKMKNIRKNFIKQFEIDHKAVDNENYHQYFIPKCLDALYNHIEKLPNDYEKNENLCFTDIREKLSLIEIEAELLKEEAIDNYLITAMEEEAQCLKQKSSNIECLDAVSKYLETKSVHFENKLKNLRISKQKEIIFEAATCKKRMIDDYEEKKEKVYREFSKCVIDPGYLEKLKAASATSFSRFLQVSSDIVNNFFKASGGLLKNVQNPIKQYLGDGFVNRILEIIIEFLEQKHGTVTETVRAVVHNKLRGFNFLLKNYVPLNFNLNF